MRGGGLGLFGWMDPAYTLRCVDFGWGWVICVA